MDKIRIDVASSSDRDDLVIEISTGPYTFASLSMEDGEISIGVYTNPWNVNHHFLLEDFEVVIAEGKKILLGLYGDADRVGKVDME